MVDQQTKENVTEKSTWLRFLYMVLFAVIFNIGEFIIVVVVIVQFITKLFTRDVHERLQEFGDSIAQYIAELVRYLTFHSEDLPFPFGEWPTGQVTRRKRARKKKSSADQQTDTLEAPKDVKDEKDDTPPSGGASSIGGGTDTPPSSGGPASS